MDITSGTASMAKPTIGRTIAADPSIPFGTVIRINGKKYVVEDRGGAIKGNVIDILCESEQRAEQLGTYNTEIFIYDEKGHKK